MSVADGRKARKCRATCALCFCFAGCSLFKKSRFLDDLLIRHKRGLGGGFAGALEIGLDEAIADGVAGAVGKTERGETPLFGGLVAEDVGADLVETADSERRADDLFGPPDLFVVQCADPGTDVFGSVELGGKGFGQAL